MGTFQLFVDDSGNREYDDARDYEKSGRSRYFVYGAVLIEQRDGSLFVVRLRELKALVFGTPDVEVKSNWLRIPDERANRYLRPYRLTEAELTEFVDGYYKLIQLAPLKLLASVVDKLHMQESYVTPWYAPTAAYEVLLQRAVQAVGTGQQLAVTIDDISGSTPQKNNYRQLLAAHHKGLVSRGSSLQKNISFSPLHGDVRFVNSAHSDLVQVADVVSYNVHRQFRDHGSEWETEPQGGGSLPLYEHFERLVGKFYTDAKGRIQGYGIAKFPLKNRVRWRVIK